MPERGATPPYTLRPVAAGDFAFLRDLHAATIRDYVDQTWGWDDAAQAARFREAFDTRMRRIADGEADPEAGQIVVVDGQNAGVLEVERRADGLFIANIAIAPPYQGRGLGATLIRAVLAVAAREGVPTRLRVLRVNPARHLYERLGFAICGETLTHYLMEAVPVPLPPQFRVSPQLNFAEAWRFIVLDPHWKRKVALGVLCSLFIPLVVGIVPVQGYLLTLAERVAWNEQPVLPEWNHFATLLRKGLRCAPIVFPYYFFLFCPFAFLTIWMVAWGTNIEETSPTSDTAAGAGLAIVFALTAPLVALTSALLPAIHARLILGHRAARTRFRPLATLRFIGRYPVQYALLLTVMLPNQGLLAFGGLCGALIGGIVALFVCQLFQYHLLGQLCRHKRTTGRVNVG